MNWTSRFLMPLTAGVTLMVGAAYSAQADEIIINDGVTTYIGQAYFPNGVYRGTSRTARGTSPTFVPGVSSRSANSPYRSGFGQIITGEVVNSTLINPVVIGAPIVNSTLINPLIVDSPSYGSTTVILRGSSRFAGQSSSRCLILADLRAACQ